MEFRALRADEVECRISTIKKNGCSLLLYKDARCDMNILDETVKPENWQRSHELINGNLFCNVSIKCGSEWITKQDVGKESYAEKEKGQASDAFKRACFNWGIGRELYTAPFIWINANDVNITEEKGKAVTYDRFSVTELKTEKGKIVLLEIKNNKTNKVVFRFGKSVYQQASSEPTITSEQVGKLKVEMLRTGITETYLCEYYKLDKLIDMTQEQYVNAMGTFKKTPDKKQVSE